AAMVLGDVLRLHPPFLPHSPPPQGVSPSPLEPHPGSKVSVSCEAESAHPDLTLLYWLGNGSFVEQLQPNVREGAVREEERGSLVTLRRDLHFNSFSFQDLRTNFTCVLLSPFGVDVRELKWATPKLVMSVSPAVWGEGCPIGCCVWGSRWGRKASLE
uniref:Ig-like domain-containing protein n=1 Tax=Phasianus colchicus TaxID=9054 RepID=A0A669Q190_PHACC